MYTKNNIKFRLKLMNGGDSMNLKKILTRTFSMIIALMMPININAESYKGYLSSEKTIIEEEITDDFNVTSRVATKKK